MARLGAAWYVGGATTCYCLAWVALTGYALKRQMWLALLTATVPGQTTPMSDKGKWFVIMKKQADGSWKRTADGWNSDDPPPKS